MCERGRVPLACRVARVDANQLEVVVLAPALPEPQRDEPGIDCVGRLEEVVTRIHVDHPARELRERGRVRVGYAMVESNGA